MYIKKGKRITKKTIEKEVLKAIEQFNKRYPRKKITFDYNGDLECCATSIYDLNNALLKDHEVFAICEKEPRGNLDTGNHYYSIHYVKDNQVQTFWCMNFMKYFHCKENSCTSGLPKWAFGSGVIGMSRLLDATDNVFSFLKRIGGCYAQIGCR